MAAKKRDRNVFMEGWINVKSKATVLCIDERGRKTIFVSTFKRVVTCVAQNNSYKNLYGQLKQHELWLFLSEPTPVQTKVEHVMTLLDVQGVVKDDGRKAAFPTLVVKYRNKTITHDVRIRAAQQQLQEKWFNYVHTVAMMLSSHKTSIREDASLKIPANTSALLPGQVEELKDIVKNLEQSNYVKMNAAAPVPLPRPGVRKVPHGSSTSFSPPNNPSQPAKLPLFLQKNILNGSPKTQHRPNGPISPKQNSTAQAPPLSPKPFNYSPGTSPTDKSPGAKSTSAQSSRSSSTSRDCPSWLLDDYIGRTQAEEILTDKSNLGNLIVRRRSNDPNEIWQYAVSIKMIGTLPSQYKHYKVQKKSDRGETAYLINLAGSQPVFSSFDDIVNYFVDINSNAYRPMRAPDDNHTYDDTVLPPSLYTLVEGNDAYENETFEQDYNNVTGDVRNATRKSATLPQAGRVGNAPPPILPRQPSAPTFSMNSNRRINQLPDAR